METIKIPHDIIVTNLGYLTKNDRFDILGAILTYKGLIIPDGTKLPSQLKKEYHPFTHCIRRMIVDTELSLGLARLDYLSRKEAIVKANEILKPYYMQIDVHY